MRMLPLLLIAAMALSSCATTMPQLAPVVLPPLAPVQHTLPGECTAAAFGAFAPGLSALPPWYLSVPAEDQRRTLLLLKLDDAQQYLLLRGQAVHCATVVAGWATQ